MMIRAVFVGLALIALGACATTPIPTGSAVHVPRDRILSLRMLEPAPGFGQVIVKRDDGFGASACSSRVFANGSAVADIRPGEKVVFYLPEGSQMLAARANGICTGGLVEAQAQISIHRPAVYRISYGSSGEFSIQPTAF